MVDLEVLQQRDVESRRDAAVAQMHRQRIVHRHVIARHHGAVVRPRGALADPDRKNREVVEEERAEVVAVEDDQRIESCGLNRFGNAGIQRHGRMLAGVLLDLGRQMR
jgi:hypothetical protein